MQRIAEGKTTPSSEALAAECEYQYRETIVPKINAAFARYEQALLAIYEQAQGTPSFDRLAEIASIAKDALSARRAT